MSRYIDAEKLKETITDNFLNSYERSHIHDLIDIQPAADVQEVKHGKWVKDEFDNTICSCCKQYVAENEDGYAIQELKDFTPPFCPNCGAKMDGDEK